MANSMLLTCPVGLEDLVRGDLRDEDGVASKLLRPGVIRLESGVVRERVSTMVDRVAVQLPLESGFAMTDLVSQLRDIDWQSVGLDDGHGVAFRVHLPGEAQRGVRESIVEGLVSELGWCNQPADWTVNIDVSADALAAGVARVELGRWAWTGRFGHFERLPATTPGPVAAGLLRLAKLRDGDRLLDPCAGVGTVPIVDGLMRGGPAYGSDQDPEAVAIAGENIASLAVQQSVSMRQADAANLPFDDSSIDRVVSDLPFGKRIGSNELNKTLYPAILRELERLLAADGRCVLLSDDKRVFAESVAHARGLKISGERVIRYNGVTPTAYIVRRSRRPKRGRA